jgi:uncharacterized protein YjbJ (UPF0337 family)
MKSSKKDKIKGKFHEARGAAKEEAGKANHDPKLTAKGQDEKFAGKVQKKIGQIEKVFGK